MRSSRRRPGSGRNSRGTARIRPRELTPRAVTPGAAPRAPGTARCARRAPTRSRGRAARRRPRPWLPTSTMSTPLRLGGRDDLVARVAGPDEERHIDPALAAPRRPAPARPARGARGPGRPGPGTGRPGRSSEPGSITDTTSSDAPSRAASSSASSVADARRLAEVRREQQAPRTARAAAPGAGGAGRAGVPGTASSIPSLGAAAPRRSCRRRPPSGTTMSMLTMPNIPSAPSTWGRMWQWNAHSAGRSAVDDRRPSARPG